MAEVWICQTCDGRKTCHATESGALAEATLIQGTSKVECVVYRADVEGMPGVIKRGEVDRSDYISKPRGTSE